MEKEEGDFGAEIKWEPWDEKEKEMKNERGTEKTRWDPTARDDWDWRTVRGNATRGDMHTHNNTSTERRERIEKEKPGDPIENSPFKIA